MCTNTLQNNSTKIIVRIRVVAPWWDSRCSYLIGKTSKYLRKAKKYVWECFLSEYKKYAARNKKRNVCGPTRLLVVSVHLTYAARNGTKRIDGKVTHWILSQVES